ncbi:unnamed protein product [Musa acuminata subsp. malaccensis]|uniref:(wild Malaysian banana) hypothetical protein n=1 Tax=Musa acuminata subsp. malaccensis TaxID=214687 RepID=A0A804K816_MUSAM|nr:PREDICTED: uncharacterized protein LOC103974562 [Musa acuminata subsp. malaccensis]CAG1832034.1 unnamed protein product [Musa acuminata subsp. malaccensis]
MASSSRRSTCTVLTSRRSISPGGGSSAFASSSSSFAAWSHASFLHHDYQHHRSGSPTRVHLLGTAYTPAPGVRFTIDRSTSPGRSLATANKRSSASVHRTCLCSPTTHPGSFRCSLHKGLSSRSAAVSAPSNCLNARRSAMTNSLVRIGTVEGDWVKRALAALIRPSSHQQRRRVDFQPRPSRLSRMSKADDP